MSDVLGFEVGLFGEAKKGGSHTVVPFWEKMQIT